MSRLKQNRVCPRCKIRISSDYSSYCKPCASAYQSAQLKKTGYKWVNKRRQELRELIQSAKKKPCVDCKKTYPSYVMDFDHTKDDKKFNISSSTRRGGSLETVQKEIDKCEVVCANCHRIRTHHRSSKKNR